MLALGPDYCFSTFRRVPGSKRKCEKILWTVVEPGRRQQGLMPILLGGRFYELRFAGPQN